MIKLSPSILSADFSKLGEEIKIVEKAGAHYIHIDVMDGHFVPNISMGPAIIRSVRKHSSLIFDVHLMIENPEKYLEDFKEAGADIINVHSEVFKDASHLKNALIKIRELKAKSGITIKPKTPVSDILPVIEYADLVLIMSVEPGFGGQKLIPETLHKASSVAEYIKKNKLNTELEIDGGININNVMDAVNAGVNVIVAGSAIFGAQDIGEATRKFIHTMSL